MEKIKKIGRIGASRGFWAAAALYCFSSCDSSSQTIEPPAQLNDGWETASLESVGMNPDRFEDLLDLMAKTENHEFHSILVVKDSKLVFEEYWPGTDLLPTTLEQVSRDFERETLHWVASVSKSITSALVGIALDRGIVGGVDEPIFSFFPEYEHLQNDQNGGIAVEHLLSFSSGYEWNEMEYGFDDPRDSHYQMFHSTDPLEYLLGRPMVSQPGAEFLYNSGDTNLAGEIIRRSSASETLAAFAENYLFAPLGIDSYAWERFPQAQEIAFASGGVSLKPRDMAKFGAMFLSGGTWRGTRILSSSWVAASTQKSISLSEGWISDLDGYGYNWFLGNATMNGAPAPYYRAAGWGGQNVFVFPGLQLVVVLTQGNYYEAGPIDGNDIVEDYILAAIED